MVALLLVGGVLLALPAVCSPMSEIVVTGAAGGSHLDLQVSEGMLTVEGAMDPAESSGCSYGRHNRARCRLDQVGRLEVRTKEAGDKVQVLNPLPVPLTVYLGNGSDKFIGNDEPDTCYSEGARRNRCIGGGGNDTCITGSQNSDCVGGPGDDVCRHGGGSDGCWGGPGDDVCYMGAGEDGCHGGPGNDRLFGGPGTDRLYGGPGFDYCDGGPGVGHSYECEAGARG
jgi:hypothetical protein